MASTGHLETIAMKCVAACPSDGVQLAVISIGMGLEILAHHIMAICAASSAGLRMVAVPDHFLTDSNAVRRFAESLASLQAGSQEVHVFVEGTPPRDRCKAYAAPSCTVVAACRIICADLLHKRLSPGLVSACVAVLPASMTTAKVIHSARSVAFTMDFILQSRSQAKLFIATDNPCAVAAACRGKKGGVLSQWRCTDVQLFPHIRVDVSVEIGNRHGRGPGVQWTRSRTAMTKTAAALQEKLRGIVSEILSELRVVDASRAAVATTGNGQQVRKRAREGVAAPDLETGKSSIWWESSNPVGVDLVSLTVDAVVAGAFNGLDGKLQQASHSSLVSLAPYRPLLRSLLDVRNLLLSVATASAGDLLLQLEESIVFRKANQLVCNDGGVAWTSSQLFLDVLTLASARVYCVGSAPATIDVDNEDASGDVEQEAAVRIRAVPAEISSKLTLLKNHVLSWCRSKRSTGELLVVTSSRRSLMRIVHCLTNSQENFARIELNHFLDSYRNHYGAHVERGQARQTRGTPARPAPLPKQTVAKSSLFISERPSDKEAADAAASPSASSSDDEEPLLLSSDDEASSARHTDNFRSCVRAIALSQESSAAVSSCASASFHEILLSHPQLKLQEASSVTAGTRLQLCGFHGSAYLVFPGGRTTVRVVCSRDLDAVALRDLLEAASSPRRILVYESDLAFLRTVETCQNVFESCGELHLELFEEHGSVADDMRRLALEQELHAIKNLGQLKAETTAQLFCTYAERQRTAAELDRGTIQRRQRGAASSAPAPAGEPPAVIFDEREFRSDLPYELFRRGIMVTPMTLRHGDYFLSRTHVVERKAPSDLLHSLESGRLHRQLASLGRIFQFPILLVEFERGADFRLSYSSSWRVVAGRRQNVTLAKIAKVVAVMPRVGWVWARSPSHTADMVLRWKNSFAKENASIVEASHAGGALEGASEATRVAITVLSRFPGVSSLNVHKVMQLCGSLQGLAALSCESLVEAIGETDGKTLHSFLHAKL